MKQQATKTALLAFTIAGMAWAWSFDAIAADAEAATTLARQSNCFKCHAIDKKKDGPAWKEVAAKYKGKAGAQERLITHITSGEKAKFEDGHEEEHPIVKSKDKDAIKNLVDYILSL